MLNGAKLCQAGNPVKTDREAVAQYAISSILVAMMRCLRDQPIVSTSACCFGICHLWGAHASGDVDPTCSFMLFFSFLFYSVQLGKSDATAFLGRLGLP